MTKHLELYKCEICGNIVQIMHEGEGELICCGKPMTKLTPHTIEEEMNEKHVPVFIEDKVQVGSTPHPMVKEHYIEFIQCMTADKKYIQTKFLHPEHAPDMNLDKQDYTLAREYCNIHGLWAGNK